MCYHELCCIKKAGPSLEKIDLLFLQQTRATPRLLNNNAMITIFCSQFKGVSQEIYDSVIKALQLHRMTCSCGHKACLSVHGYYGRGIKNENGTIIITICRVRCSVCGHTHAILLSSMVPYSQIQASHQWRICADYESKHDVCSICDDVLAIDENNVKYVLRNYRKHWREMLRSIRLTPSSFTELVLSCFSNYSMQFMQIRRTTNRLFHFTT